MAYITFLWSRSLDAKKANLRKFMKNTSQYVFTIILTCKRAVMPSVTFRDLICAICFKHDMSPASWNSGIYVWWSMQCFTYCPKSRLDTACETPSFTSISTAGISASWEAGCCQQEIADHETKAVYVHSADPPPSLHPTPPHRTLYSPLYPTLP